MADCVFLWNGIVFLLVGRTSWFLNFVIGVYILLPKCGFNVCLEMKYKERQGADVALRGGPVSSTDYHSPDEKPPGGMRFLLMTWPAPFSDGTVVLISAAPPDL